MYLEIHEDVHVGLFKDRLLKDPVFRGLKFGTHDNSTTGFVDGDWRSRCHGLTDEESK